MTVEPLKFDPFLTQFSHSQSGCYTAAQIGGGGSGLWESRWFPPAGAESAATYRYFCFTHDSFPSTHTVLKSGMPAACPFGPPSSPPLNAGIHVHTWLEWRSLRSTLSYGWISFLHLWLLWHLIATFFHSLLELYFLWLLMKCLCSWKFCLRLPFSSPHILFLDNLNHPLNVNEPQIQIASLDLSPEHRTCISSFLLNISADLYHRYVPPVTYLNLNSFSVPQKNGFSVSP